MESIFDVSALEEFFNVSSYSHDLPDHLQSLADAITEHLTQCKYLRVISTQPTATLLSDSFAQARLFFLQSESLKLSCVSVDRARRGYSPSGYENFASLIGASHKPNDLVEKYRIGPILSDEEKQSYDIDGYLSSKEGRIHYFTNNWPDKELLPDFESCVTRYYKYMEKLSLVLLHAIEVSLRLDDRPLTRGLDKHTSILSMNCYKGIDMSDVRAVGERIDGDRIIRVSDHTDVSMLTIVSQWIDSASTSPKHGLELLLNNQSNEEVWTAIQPGDSFIVHVGDCLEYWSRGRFRSIRHRVVSELHSDQPYDRYSMAYFVAPAYNAQMKMFTGDALGNVGEERESPSISYSVWRKDHIKKALRIQQNNRHK